MGFVNYIIELLRDCAFIASSMIATGPLLLSYGFVFWFKSLLFETSQWKFFSIFIRVDFLFTFGGSRILFLLITVASLLFCCLLLRGLPQFLATDELYDWPPLFGQKSLLRKGQSTYPEHLEKTQKWTLRSSCNFLRASLYPHVCAFIAGGGREVHWRMNLHL